MPQNIEPNNDLPANHINSSNIAYSVVIPLLNEETNLDPLYTRLTAVMELLAKPYEIIFVDDGSRDNSLKILKQIHQKDKRVKVISFTRNFGQHIAVTAGLDLSKGESVVLMDADLQDQPEEIPKLLAKIDEGFEIVYSKPTQRQDTLFKKITSKLYLNMLSKLTNSAINPEIPSFRVMTRKVVDYFNQFRERSRFFGGMVAWMGFSYAVVPTEHSNRFSGKTKYSLVKMFRMGLEGIISFSDFPLRLIGTLGLIVSILSFLVGLYYVLVWMIQGIPTPGYTSLIVAVFFMGGVQLTVLGIISRYLGSIHVEMKKRPIYIVKEKLE
jgi:polyisoprenyl-phosphate glycosyltransferase